MNKKLSIFSFPDKNPEYLQPQIDSYNKYMNNGDTEFIVINASNENSEIIEKICSENNVRTIKYEGPRNVHWSNYYVAQLNWFRDNIQSEINNLILLMHSDMFFINTLDYEKLMKNKKIYYNPQYKDTPFHKITDGNFKYSYMWDGLLLIDSGFFNENNLTKLFVWDQIPNISDVGGSTMELVKNLSKEDCGYFEFYNYNHFKNDIMTISLNGGVTYEIDVINKTFVNSGIFEFNLPRSVNTEPQMGNKSFPYENDNDNYKEYLSNKFIDIKRLFVDGFDYTDPVSIDIILPLGYDIENAPILHFKSGSGYSPFYNLEYSTQKLKQIKKIINRD